MTRTHRVLVPALLGAALMTFAAPAFAQGKGKAKADAHAAVQAQDAHAAPQSGAKGQNHIPPGQAKKVTTDAAVVSLRDVFQNNGYRVVKVEQVGTTRVVWYRRGNMGKGKGQGPLEKVVIRPSNNIVVFQSSTAPSALITKIKSALGI